MKKIVSYRRAYTRRLDKSWDWACPVWFSEGMFADATIHSIRTFKNRTECIKDMDETMALFVTKETKRI
jgi:hypothetical protein